MTNRISISHVAISITIFYNDNFDSDIEAYRYRDMTSLDSCSGQINLIWSMKFCLKIWSGSYLDFNKLGQDSDQILDQIQSDRGDTGWK